MNRFLLFANPGPEYMRDVEIAAVVILALAACFVGATSVGVGERDRRLKLALLSFFAGPALAASLAGLAHAIGGLHPLDVGHHYTSIIGIGVIAGFVVGLFFTVTSLVSSNHHNSPPRDLDL